MHHYCVAARGTCAQGESLEMRLLPSQQPPLSHEKRNSPCRLRSPPQRRCRPGRHCSWRTPPEPQNRRHRARRAWCRRRTARRGRCCRRSFRPARSCRESKACMTWPRGQRKSRLQGVGWGRKRWGDRVTGSSVDRVEVSKSGMQGFNGQGASRGVVLGLRSVMPTRQQPRGWERVAPGQIEHVAELELAEKYPAEHSCAGGRAGGLILVL